MTSQGVSFTEVQEGLKLKFDMKCFIEMYKPCFKLKSPFWLNNNYPDVRHSQGDRQISLLPNWFESRESERELPLLGFKLRPPAPQA